jgi:hypothetical protein
VLSFAMEGTNKTVIGKVREKEKLKLKCHKNGFPDKNQFEQTDIRQELL